MSENWFYLYSVYNLSIRRHLSKSDFISFTRILFLYRKGIANILVCEHFQFLRRRILQIYFKDFSSFVVRHSDKSYKKTAPKKLQKRSQFHRALVPLRALASRAVDQILQWVYSSPSTAARSRLDRNCPNQSFIFSLSL